MKKTITCISLSRERLIKLLIMRTILLLMLFCTVNVTATTYAQKARLNLNVQNASFSDVIIQLQKQSEFYFFYKSEDIPTAKKITANLTNSNIDQVMGMLLEGTNLKYKVIDKYIAIADKSVIEEPQQRQLKVTGKVTDNNGQPMAGVTVAVIRTNRAVITDASGMFSLPLNATDKTITFSFIGMKRQEVDLNGQAVINVSLESEAKTLDEVVVVGYGTQSKRNITGSVSTVDPIKTLRANPVTDIARGLQGATPGLTITTPSGDLGSNPKITLRGLQGSMNGNGAQPLILLDNVQIPNLQVVNPDDIETVSVLKDAASTSIYGARAAWGVILLTSKTGKKGSPSRISYSTNFSYGTPTFTPMVANAADGAQMALLALRRTTPTLTQFGVVGIYYDDIAVQKIRDWQATYGNQNLSSEMVLGRDYEIRDGKAFYYRPWDPGKMYMKDWAPQQKHDINISGGSDKIGYTLSSGYLGQKGVLKVNPDEFDRLNVTLGVTAIINKWFNARSKLMVSNTTTKTPFSYGGATYDPWYYLYRWPTTYPYGTIDGKPLRSAITEVTQAKMNEDKTGFTRLSVGGTFNLIPGLTLDADYTYSATNTHFHTTGGSVTAWDFWAGGGQMTYGPYTSASYDYTSYTSSWNTMNTGKAFATYIKSIKNHSLKVIAGTDVELYQAWSQTSKVMGLMDPNKGELPLASGLQYGSGGHSNWATLGYFGRINYAFKNRYLVELNGRYDGSSSFPVKDQWAFFPSMSVGYLINEEPYMAFAKPVIDLLKIRGSYGSVGNQDVGGNAFIPTMGSTTSGWLNSVNLLTVGTPGAVSPSLTWETVTTTDLGFDTRFFKDQFGITADWFQRKTSNMLSSGLTVPSSFGTSAPRRNFGELTTTGWEVSIDYKHSFKNGLNINATLMLSDFKEVLTKWAGSNVITSNYQGKTLGEIWGYETDRLFQEDDFIGKDANNHYILKPGIASQSKFESGWFYYGPGDVKYKDLNHDSIIYNGTNTLADHGDMKVIGNTTPHYQYGIRLGASFKGFDLDIFFQGVGKRDMWASGSSFIPGFKPGEAWFENQLDYWTADNTNAYYPRPTDQGQSNSSKNFLPQSKYLLNLSYCRLKNLTFGYTLPTQISKKVMLQSVRVYFSGQNLFEIANVGIPLDPEISYTNSGLNDPATFGKVYPYRRTYSFGIQVTL